MNYYLSLLWILCLVFNFQCTPSSNPDSITSTILTLEQKLLDGIAIGDQELWRAHIMDSCIITLEDGKRLTPEDFIETMAPLPPTFKGTIKVIHPKFNVLGESSVIISFIADEYLELYNQRIHTQYAVTNTWIKAGTWKLAAMQTFEIPSTPTPSDLPSYVHQLTGTYSLTDEVTYTITFEDGKLMGQRSGREKEELFCESGSVFFTENNARIRKIFVSEGDSISKMLDRRGDLKSYGKKQTLISDYNEKDINLDDPFSPLLYQRFCPKGYKHPEHTG